MVLFEKDRQTFIETGTASDFFQNFLTLYTAQANFNTGYLAFPSDWQHTSAVRSYYEGNEYPVDMVESSQWGDVLISKLNPPTLRFAKCSEFGNIYRFAPKNVGTVFVDYFKTPVAPHWNFTIVNDEEVYSASGSVDFEFDLFSMNNVAAVYLKMIGCDIKDEFLTGFANQFAAETNSIL